MYDRSGNLLFGKDVFKGEKGVTEYGEVNTVTTSAEYFWYSVGGEGAPIGEAFVRDATNIVMREMILGYNLLRVFFPGRHLLLPEYHLLEEICFFFLTKLNKPTPKLRRVEITQLRDLNHLLSPLHAHLGYHLFLIFKTVKGQS
jgi:hypothetical protein